MPNLIGLFDIETTGLHPDFDDVLCAVVKPWGGAPVVFREDAYERPRRSENPQMARDIIAALSEYTVLIAHNGTFFDRKFLNALAAMYDLPALNPRGKIIDPVLIARRHLNFSSNRLEALTDVLRTRHHKTKLDRWVWRRAALDGDKAALDTIVAHCRMDVTVLEEITWRLRHFIREINERGSD